MKRVKIRTEILNLTMWQWDKIRKREKDGCVEFTIKEMREEIGFDGGMFFSFKATDEELMFIKDFYKQQ